LLSKRNGIFYFRVAIPKDLRKVFGRITEIKKSLKTRNRKTAQVSVAFYRYKVESLFSALRWGMITEEQANKIRSKIIGETIEDLQKCEPLLPKQLSYREFKSRISSHSFSKEQILDALTNGIVPDKNYIEDQMQSIYSDDAEYGLNENIHPYVLDRVHELIDEFKLDVLKPDLDCNPEGYALVMDPKINKDFLDLCIIVSKTIHHLTFNEGHKLGVDMDHLPSLDEKSHHRLIKQYKDGLPDPKLSELWDAYVTDKTQRNEWRVRTIEKYADCYKTVKDIIGDIILEQFGSRTVQALIGGLKNYPKNKNKLKQFKDKPFSKSMSKMQGFLPLDIKSINFIIGMMSGLFNFALEDRRRWKIDTNPFFRKQIKDVRKKEPHEFRREFTIEELQKIINELGNLKRFVDPEKFWVPLICLYSGMRINEACQLRIKDIEFIDDIPVFQIRHNPSMNQETKNGKNRTVPIHYTLQGLGFLDYVAWQKERKADRLFPKLKIFKGKWSKKVDAWFNRTVLRDHLKFVPEVSFHSTKHSFINWYKQNINMNYSELNMLKTIAAHFDDKSLTNKFDDGGITTNLYGKDYQIQALYEFINKLDYKIDITVLKHKGDISQ
jgi:integrase